MLLRYRLANGAFRWALIAVTLEIHYRSAGGAGGSLPMPDSSASQHDHPAWREAVLVLCDLRATMCAQLALQSVTKGTWSIHLVIQRSEGGPMGWRCPNRLSISRAVGPGLVFHIFEEEKVSNRISSYLNFEAAPHHFPCSMITYFSIKAWLARFDHGSREGK
jgi:hypothetical protein